MQALPDKRETLKAIDKLDLLVVCETIPSEMAGYADVILPEAIFLERYDELLTGFGRVGWTALRQPVVAPPHEQKPGWWIAKELAGKLGIAECMPFKDMEEYLKVRIEKSGLDWETLKKDGVIMGQAQADHRRRGPRARVRHAVEEGRVLVRTARQGRLRPGAEVQAAGQRAGGPPADDHRALRRCTPSAARRAIRCCTT